MDTAVEEIFSKKCCGFHDMNFEIQLKNTGKSSVSVHSYMDLEGKNKTFRIDYLFPTGVHVIKPGDQMSFYCYMDEYFLAGFDKLVVHECDGHKFEVEIPLRNE